MVTQRLGSLLAGTLLAVIALTVRHPLPLAVLVVVAWPGAPRPRWPLLSIAAAGLVLNGLLSWNGDTVLWRAPFTLSLLGRPMVTQEALLSGLTTSLQLLVAGLAAAIALTRTPPDALARLVPGAGPRIAVHLALRALPDLGRDAQAMRHALRARGIETRGVRGGSHLLVPLVARSLDRTAATVEVLHARGAGSRSRPAARVVLTAAGTLALAGIALWLGALWTGAAPRAAYYPHLDLGSAGSWRTWTPLVGLLAWPGVRP